MGDESIIILQTEFMLDMMSDNVTTIHEDGEHIGDWHIRDCFTCDTTYSILK